MEDKHEVALTLATEDKHEVTLTLVSEHKHEVKPTLVDEEKDEVTLTLVNADKHEFTLTSVTEDKHEVTLTLVTEDKHEATLTLVSQHKHEVKPTLVYEEKDEITLYHRASKAKSTFVHTSQNFKRSRQNSPLCTLYKAPKEARKSIFVYTTQKTLLNIHMFLSKNFGFSISWSPYIFVFFSKSVHENLHC